MSGNRGRDSRNRYSGKNRGRGSYSYGGRRSGGGILKFRFKVIFGIFLLVTGICFAIYITGANFRNAEQGTFTATWKDHPELSSSQAQAEESSSDSKNEDKEDDKEGDKNSEISNPVPKSDARSQSYLAKCVFVGDSITVGLSDYQLVSMKNVIAEVGMNIEKINTETMQTPYGELTVLDALKEAEPENIYIMLGSNGIAWMDTDSMIGEYSSLLDGIQESLDSNIYIISIPPVTAARESGDDPISNSDIDSYNSRLLELANEKKCWFIDLNSELKGEDGKFPTEDAAEAGMHFNKTTYDKMLQFILSHVAE